MHQQLSCWQRWIFDNIIWLSFGLDLSFDNKTSIVRKIILIPMTKIITPMLQKIFFDANVFVVIGKKHNLMPTTFRVVSKSCFSMTMHVLSIEKMIFFYANNVCSYSKKLFFYANTLLLARKIDFSILAHLTSMGKYDFLCQWRLVLLQNINFLYFFEPIQYISQ